MLRLRGMDSASSPPVDPSADSTSSLQASSPQTAPSTGLGQPVGVPTQAVVAQVPEPVPAGQTMASPVQAVGPPSALGYGGAQQAVQSGVVSQAPAQQGPQPMVGSVQKEVLPPQKTPEIAPVVEVGKDKELEPEVEGWIEHLKQEGEIKLPEPIKDDQGNVVMAEAPAQVVNDKLVVPMTQAGVTQGLKQPVTSSARWLSEWIKRLVKMFGNKIAYKKVD